MILHAFSVYDSKATAYMPPFFAPTAGVACRMFEQACSDSSHDFHKHSDDYTLHQVGSFDQGTGEFISLAQLINLGVATSFINPNERSN